MESKSKSIKCSETQVGRIVIHKGEEEKRIYKNELNSFLDNGWVEGISDSHRKILSEKKKGNKPWNTGASCRNETREKISNSLKGNIPWNKGLKGKQTAWNKGLTKELDNRVNKISLSKMGHKVSKETIEKIVSKNKGRKMDKDKLLIKVTKDYITRKKNNSFNTSSKEESFYNFLLKENVNKTVYRQYKSDKYPFYCDFYILEDDLYIELNLHWTHGGKPFDPDDIDCQKQLADWQEKAKTSKFYENAIQTWTVRDVKKQRIAKENNLNYKVIY